MTLDNAMSPEAEDMKTKTKLKNSLYRKGFASLVNRTLILHPVNQCSIVARYMYNSDKKINFLAVSSGAYRKYATKNSVLIIDQAHLWASESKSIFKERQEQQTKLKEMEKRNLDLWHDLEKGLWSAE